MKACRENWFSKDLCLIIFVLISTVVFAVDSTTAFIHINTSNYDISSNSSNFFCGSYEHNAPAFMECAGAKSTTYNAQVPSKQKAALSCEYCECWAAQDFADHFIKVYANDVVPKNNDVSHSPQVTQLTSEYFALSDSGQQKVLEQYHCRTLGEAFEWDVQLSKIGKQSLGWMTRDNTHLNVSLRGRVTHK